MRVIQFEVLKKIFPLTFLIIFLFNVAGYFILFKVEHFQIKHEIRSKIEKGIFTEFLTVITINKSERSSIEWLESDQEFRYKNNLYDVVRFTKTENTISYYCINDSEEESLFSDLTEHVNTHVATNNSQKRSKKAENHIIKLYFLPIQKSVIPVTQIVSVVFPVQFANTSVVFEKQTPPLELI